jgi:hypothetical protein
MKEERSRPRRERCTTSCHRDHDVSIRDVTQEGVAKRTSPSLLSARSRTVQGVCERAAGRVHWSPCDGGPPFVCVKVCVINSLNDH